jgi:GNAT superfamily N-acetyltransferase
MTLFADRALATRLEAHCAAEMERFVVTARELDPACAAEAMSVAGGSAVFVSPESPLNQAFGLGMRGPVTTDDVAAVEGFYLDRGVRPLMGVCPLAHPSLLAHLGARGWVAEGFENVLIRSIEPVVAAVDPTTEHVEILPARTAEEKRTWALVAAAAFCAPLPPIDEQLLLAQLAANRPGAQLFTAFVDGQPAGTGELYLSGEVAWLSADATLPQFRRRGIQGALQRHRLTLASRAGCTLAVTESAPGSPSQRNMERLGFRVAYTRLDMMLSGEGRAAGELRYRDDSNDDVRQQRTSTEGGSDAAE